MVIAQSTSPATAFRLKHLGVGARGVQDAVDVGQLLPLRVDLPEVGVALPAPNLGEPITGMGLVMVSRHRFSTRDSRHRIRGRCHWFSTSNIPSAHVY